MLTVAPGQQVPLYQNLHGAHQQDQHHFQLVPTSCAVFNPFQTALLSSPVL